MEEAIVNNNAIIEAHKSSMSNFNQLEASSICGCFYCLKIFDPAEIKEWIEDKNGPTALCPYCDIDSVIGDTSGYPITKEFLEAMYEYWFT